jgi:Tfp pilus assembly protein PilX
MQTRVNGPGRREEAGFALVLAILALMLLTFLGLTLAITTSSELQIASNYRWTAQARYNSEAGLELGKSLLRTMNWSLILPSVRMTNSGAPCDPNSPPGQGGNFRCWFDDTPIVVPTNAPFSRATRNYENGACDRTNNGVGYGVVLDDGGGFGPYEFVNSWQGHSLNGTFTLWIRRELHINAGGSQSDEAGKTAPDDILVLTSEGTAPFTGNFGVASSPITRSLFYMEASLRRTLGTPCGTRGGQIGGGPEGSNFSPCDPITGASVAAGLGGPVRMENTGVQ